MARVKLEDEMVKIPELRADGRNWSAYHKRLKRALNGLGMATYLNETTPNPFTIPPNSSLQVSLHCVLV
ncbi:hypothetical protein BDN67DRAFT_1017795 [Paxillus ammoniavirescens]|nr:hypothetical protein BDN67DRAFT_1017795 [Paxillus ammoniavirescens]